MNVKNGYGRNYLIPTGKGVIASPSAKKVLAENLRQQAHKLAVLKQNAEEKAKAFEGVALEIAAKVGATGQLYGSVGAAQVVAALAEKGIEVERKIVTMRDAKQLGDYEAVIHFHKEVEVKVPVKVIAENPEDLEAPVVEEAPAAVEAAAEAVEEAVEEAPVAEEEAPAAE